MLSFAAVPFTLQSNSEPIDNYEYQDSKISFATQQFDLNDLIKQTNLSDVYNSSVIFSGANFHYLIKTGITGSI